MGGKAIDGCLALLQRVLDELFGRHIKKLATAESVGRGRGVGERSVWVLAPEPSERKRSVARNIPTERTQQRALLSQQEAARARRALWLTGGATFARESVRVAAVA